MPETGRTVVVTGGSRGIGESITRAFAGAGDRVVIGGRADTGLAAELAQVARFVECDVRDEQGPRDLAEAAVDWTGRLDVWVNNAGFSAWRPLAEIDPDFLEDMLATNLAGTLWGCKAAAAHIGDGGAIVNVASIAGRRGSANNAAYCATKFGVIGITQALAKELGHRGVRVNAVCPVYVATDGLRAALADPRSPAAGADVDAYLERFGAEQAALGRLPRADEVAAACIFLASSGASAVTGQSLNVDCGVLPW